MFSRCQIRVQESARMQDFAPFTPELTGALSFPQTPGVQQLRFVQLVNTFRGLKGHFMLWGAIRLRNLGDLLVTSLLFLFIPLDTHKSIQFESESNASELSLSCESSSFEDGDNVSDTDSGNAETEDAAQVNEV